MDFQMSWEYFQLFLHISICFNRYSIRHNGFVGLSHEIWWLGLLSSCVVKRQRISSYKFTRKLPTKSFFDYRNQANIATHCLLLTLMKSNLHHQYRSSGISYGFSWTYSKRGSWQHCINFDMVNLPGRNIIKSS